jgi:hypothetical protein
MEKFQSIRQNDLAYYLFLELHNEASQIKEIFKQVELISNIIPLLGHLL